MMALAVLAVVMPMYVTESPELDGRLDEPSWAVAPSFTAFVQKDPDAGGPPSEPTSLRVLYDDDAVWFGIDCVQQRSPIVRRLTRRDREEDSDRVEVDIDSRGTGRDAFRFQVNAAGVLLDALRYHDTEIDSDWDENWEARVADTPTGWSAELRIPFRALRYPHAARQRWGLQVRRFISQRQEIDELAPIPRGEAGETSRYGSLGPFTDVPDSSNFELLPFLVAGVAQPAGGMPTQRASYGGDLRWHVTPTLTLDMTVKPDFAQVEADQQVLNLSTYEPFFPDKRPFFLEGTSLFAAPLQVLYTRRIGRVPDAPELPDPETAPTDPGPSPVWGAAKLTGTVGGDTQVGALAAVTGPNRVMTQVMAQDGTVGDHERLVDPATAYAALRLTHGLGKRGYVGMFATAVGRFEEVKDDDYPVADGMALCPDGTRTSPGTRCSHDALVAGIDARWRSASGAYLVEGDVAAAGFRGGPPRPQPDGVIIDSGRISPQTTLHAAKQDNGLVLDTTLEVYGRRFDINDAGYLKRANFIDGEWNVGWKDTTPGDHIRESTTLLGASYKANWRGERIGGDYSLETRLVLASYWRLGLELKYKPTFFDDRELGTGTALQRAARTEVDLDLASDPRKRITFAWSQSAYRVDGGLSYESDIDVVLHALQRLDLELLPTAVVAQGEQRFVPDDAIAKPAALSDRNIFAQQDAFAAGLTLRATYTFSPTMTLQLYGQLFGESVGYHDFGSVPTIDHEVELLDIVRTSEPIMATTSTSVAVNASAVFRWEWRLGSTLYLVYSRAHTEKPPPIDGAPIPWRAGLAAPADQAAVLKISYWW